MVKIEGGYRSRYKIPPLFGFHLKNTSIPAPGATPKPHWERRLPFYG